MTGRASQLLRAALALPTDDRVAVATELLASLDDSQPDDSQPNDTAAIEAAWAEEIARRARRVLAGDSTGTPWEEVHRTLEGNLGKR